MEAHDQIPALKITTGVNQKWIMSYGRSSVDEVAYRAFTNQLTANLEDSTDVLGLVAVGSMAEQDYPPDEWSDHDFFIIVQSGVQDRYRDRYDWLPAPEEIVWAFRETAHGVKVLYQSGHLLEYAVFDHEELNLAKTNRYRVLIDRAGIQYQMAVITEATQALAYETSDTFHAGQFLTNLLVGMGRYQRGELASAHLFIKASAVRHLVHLLNRHVTSEQQVLTDNIEPTRRFEIVHPEMGKELNQIVLCEIPEAVLRMLKLFKREIPIKYTGVPDEALVVVERMVNQFA